MAKRIPQRDVNLARKMIRVASGLMNTGINLLDQEIDDPEMGATYVDNRLETHLEHLLDLHSAIREYRRKVSHVEVKGQRG